MLKWFAALFSWITGLWSAMPEESKDKIINMIVEAFEEAFRSYYRKEKKKETDNNG